MIKLSGKNEGYSGLSNIIYESWHKPTCMSSHFIHIYSKEKGRKIILSNDQTANNRPLTTAT